jgi:hypothetical protein
MVAVSISIPATYPLGVTETWSPRERIENLSVGRPRPLRSGLAAGAGPFPHRWRHVDPALLQFVEHLVDALAPGFDPCAATDPGEIVVPLIERTFLIEVHHTSFFELCADIVRHLLFRSACHTSILREAGRTR